MDFASIVGILFGAALLVAAILLGGDVHNFINLPGVMIVFGGTLAATLITFQFKDVWAAVQAAVYIFTRDSTDPNATVETMVRLSRLCRKEGLMKLADVQSPSRFLRRACSLIADSSETEIIRAALRNEIESMKRRHFVVQDVFRKMAMFAPAFGMLGTLIGLIQMLSRLQDPASIGPAMAVALLTTFYGSLLSTMVFLPVAGKLKARTIVKVINLEIIFEGAVSILENSNSSMIYEKLITYIPARNRRALKSMNTG